MLKILPSQEELKNYENICGDNSLVVVVIMKCGHYETNIKIMPEITQIMCHLKKTVIGYLCLQKFSSTHILTVGHVCWWPFLGLLSWYPLVTLLITHSSYYHQIWTRGAKYIG